MQLAYRLLLAAIAVSPLAFYLAGLRGPASRASEALYLAAAMLLSWRLGLRRSLELLSTMLLASSMVLVLKYNPHMLAWLRPSGHVALATGFWAALAGVDCSTACKLTSIAGVMLMATERLLEKAHTPPELLVGVLLGLAATLPHRLTMLPRERRIALTLLLALLLSVASWGYTWLSGLVAGLAIACAGALGLGDRVSWLTSTASAVALASSLALAAKAPAPLQPLAAGAPLLLTLALVDAAEKRVREHRRGGLES